MPQYTPPLRDLQFVLHELVQVTETFKDMPAHAEVDVETVNAILEEGGKFAAQVVFPLNRSGDEEGCTLDKTTHEVRTAEGLQGSLCAVRRRWLGGAELRPGVWRPGPAARRQPVLLRDAQQRQPGVDDVPRPVARRL